MIKLLVIADDFTGALDTGAQFMAKGTQIRILNGTWKSVFGNADQNTQVLIVDTETRHLAPAAAYDIIFRLVTEAREAGIPHLYKKTDSALRGNVGSELAAMLAASGRKRLHFIPAFPQMGRITKGGLQYIDGVPVAQSVFGADPFEPVQKSDVREIIALQSDVHTSLIGEDSPEVLPDGILVFDAQDLNTMEHIANVLETRDELRYIAGCAGFAAVLPQHLNMEQGEYRRPDLPGKMLTICGSINPITLRQMDVAEQAGAVRIRLTPKQKLSPHWLDSSEGQKMMDAWIAKAGECNNLIIECGADVVGETDQYAKSLRLDSGEIRERVANTMGTILKRMLDMGLKRLLLVTGGDTLVAFLRQIDADSLILLGEVMPGVILSELRYCHKSFYLISKSGGFGSATALVDLEKKIYCSVGG